MKEIIIKNYENVITERPVYSIQGTIKIIGNDQMEASDGYHTFDELYDHRITLYIALCRTFKFAVESEGGNSQVWRSKLHSDGTSFDGWFILGIGKEPGKQITYHLPWGKWVLCDFAETLDSAPEFDGHTSADVLERLKNI